MTPGDPYADLLRRALHAEANQVMPSPDGLSRIRQRTARPSRAALGRAWFTGGWKGPLLASAAAVVMAGVAVSATPAAIDRFSSAGNETATHKQDAKTGRAVPPAAAGPRGQGDAGPGQAEPAPALRVTCAPVPHRGQPVPTATPTVTVTELKPAALASTPSCPPSTTPTVVPVPTDSVRPTAGPTGRPTAEPTTAVPTPTATPTAEPKPTATPSPEPQTPAPPAPTPTPS